MSCRHPRVYFGMCGDCGKALAGVSVKDRAATTKFQGKHRQQIEIDEETTKYLADVTTTRLLSSRKLLLVLDLDHTLIHATTVVLHCPRSEITMPLDEALVDLGGVWYHIKARRGLFAFLEDAHERFELEVYTFGTRLYADAVVGFIDPTHKYFGDRVVTRSDSSLKQKKMQWLHNVGGNDMAIIVDDSESVWEHVGNLVIIEPYVFHAGQPDVNNGPGGAPLTGGKHTKSEVSRPPPTGPSTEESHPYLTDVQELLTQVHTRYFAEYDAGRRPMVSRILQEHMSSVLDGFTVVFSGVFPLNDPTMKLSPLYRRTLQLGARISETATDPAVTHVVAETSGSKKVMDAMKRPDVRVVHTEWLRECIRRVKYLPEKGFPLPGAEACVDKTLRPRVSFKLAVAPSSPTSAPPPSFPPPPSLPSSAPAAGGAGSDLPAFASAFPPPPALGDEEEDGEDEEGEEDEKEPTRKSARIAVGEPDSDPPDNDEDLEREIEAALAEGEDSDED